MAERLERTAHELVTWNAAIAHELHTPVTILRVRLQGLAEGVFAPDEAQFRSLLRASGGSGLGLAVGRAIAQAHGRRADSSGAVFSIALPCHVTLNESKTRRAD
ncbi:hypothetical protein NHH88_19685 [Oxalobacteraceae bacterium OTU3CAMAD1]|nr:hypothetical protein NHH88_19685 [Oxalobacteraceae bacterium OTU3CAMAD1]